MRMCCHKWEWSLSATMGLRDGRSAAERDLAGAEAATPRDLSWIFLEDARVKSSVRARQPEAPRTCGAVAVAAGHYLFGADRRTASTRDRPLLRILTVSLPGQATCKLIAKYEYGRFRDVGGHRGGLSYEANVYRDVVESREREYVAAQFGSAPPSDFVERLELARLYWTLRWLGNAPEAFPTLRLLERVESLVPLARRIGVIAS